MSPPLESHEDLTTTGSIGVDNELSLLSSPKNALDPDNDQVMDLFLNQVAEYNAQQLSFDQQQQVLSNNNSEGSSSNTMGMGPSQVLAVQEQQQKQQNNNSNAKIKQEFVQLTEPAPKKEKQKSKENGHSSLLQVFTNPLLHVIPILARNCLNFEDFLAQTSLPGQSLLGPGELEDDSESRLLSSPTFKSDTPWHIRVLGLPHTGAKSRVETQIKICLQLVDTSGELVTNWSHMKLPEHLVAKDKLKRKNQGSATTTTTATQKYNNSHAAAATQMTTASIVEEKAALADGTVLVLEAAVVCDGQPDSEIIMCTSCVHRERKRLKRKRDNKVARAVSKEGGAAKVAALFANDLPDLSDETIMTEERRRILLFNCNEYVDFNSGEATLPTRVTCYCRHHSEKTGFRIVFTVRNNMNQVIATGRSPPIMITDDHKSSKLQQTAAARKRSRADADASATESDALPATTRRKQGVEMESDSAVSSPIASTPATPSSQVDESIPDSPPRDNNTNKSNGIMDKQQHPLSNDNNEHFTSQLQQQQQQQQQQQEQQQLEIYDPQHHLHQNEMFNFFNYDGLDLLSDNTHHIAPTNSQSHTQPLELVHPDQQQHILNQFTAQNPMNGTLLNNNLNHNNNLNNIRRRGNLLGNQNSNMHYQQPQPQPQQQPQQPWQSTNNVYTKLQERNALDKTPNLPRLHRLIPSEGPIYGGSEVTVLGSNFYEGLTCLFGENPAIPTHCWSANTLLCILPPVATAGPVVVSFKEHPLMLEGQDVVLFTYFDESDRALMELALQVVGLKTMGKVEDARQIAMRIVQGDNNNHGKDNNSSTNSGGQRVDAFRHELTTLAATAVYDNARKLFLSQLEQLVVASILALSQIDTEGECLNLTNRNQHNLLHLATLCNYVELVETLVMNFGDNKHLINQTDMNGFTALHFASWTGKIEIVKLLLKKSDLKITNRVGKTAERLAAEAGHINIVQLFRQQAATKATPQKKTELDNSRVPLTEFIPTDAVHFLAKSVLPSQISNLLGSLYHFSTRTKQVQRVAHSASQVYNFMLDPF